MTRLVLTALALYLFALPLVAADRKAEPEVYDPSVCAAAIESVDAAVEAAASAPCLAMAQAFPKPVFERGPLDRVTLDENSFWRVSKDGAALRSSPGGAVIGAIAPGFNFVKAVQVREDGWIQRLGGEWVAPGDVKPARTSLFTGLLLPPDWAHPFAVILDRTGLHASLRPGEPGSADSGYVTRRGKLVHIFARAEDDQGKVWYLIGPQRWIRQELVAMFAPAERPPDVAGRWVAVDLFEQTLIAYEDDQPVFATLVSSGLADWPTTEGLFKVWARLPSDAMSGARGQPDAYDLQYVPWVMYFKGGISLHGTYWHDGFGYRRSHGCVNLSVSDARWLYEWMLGAAPHEDGEIVNMVHVFSSGEYAG